MKTNFRGADKPLFPFIHKDLYALLDEDHLIFFLRSILADYDLSPIINGYRSDNVGRAPFDPGKMVLLIVFAYWRGFRSSRAIERLFEDSLGARTIFPADPPDHSTINRFRKNNEDALAALFMHALKKAQEAGLVDPSVGIVDGTKMKANSALSANESDCARIDREIEALDREDVAPVVDPDPPQTSAGKSGDDGPARRGGRRPERSFSTSRKSARLSSTNRRRKRKSGPGSKSRPEKSPGAENEKRRIPRTSRRSRSTSPIAKARS